MAFGMLIPDADNIDIIPDRFNQLRKCHGFMKINKSKYGIGNILLVVITWTIVLALWYIVILKAGILFRY